MSHKFLLATIIAFCMLNMVEAENINPSEAKQIATKFANQEIQKKATSNQLQLAYTFEGENGSNLYVFNIQDGGWVMTSAEDRVRPILAYSNEGSFDADNIPTTTLYYINTFNQAIEYARTENINVSSDIQQEWNMVRANGNISLSKNNTVVAPLVTSRWNQPSPFNSYCPNLSEGSSGHVPVGCVATAMAQLVNYWEFPNNGSGSHSYYANNSYMGNPYGDYGYQYADFGNTTYNFDLMPNYLTTGNSWEQIDAVATLSYHCGVAVDMIYGSSASGAYSQSVPEALINYFRYSTDANLKYKGSYSENEWINMLKQQLNQSYPLYYSGYGDEGGHAFVCDGYDANNFMHFNWGWGGQADGYFAVSALNPSTATFNDGQAAIFNLYPSTNCQAPKYLTATSLPTNGVKLHWDNQNGASYNVYRNNTLIAQNLNTNTYNDLNLQEGYYEYNVTASCDAQTESYKSITAIGIVDKPEYCTLTFKLHSEGSNWYGAKLVILRGNGNNDTLTYSTANATTQLDIETASSCSFKWLSGNQDSRCSFEVFYQDGQIIYASEKLGEGLLYSFVIDCGSSFGDDIETFESGDLSQYEWNNTSSYPWQISNSGSFEGQYCLKSGNAQQAGSNSEISVSHTSTESDSIAFMLKTATLANDDILHFYIDNVEQYSWSGVNAWTKVKFAVAAGTHTYKWNYIKNATGNHNTDCCFIDNIEFPFSGPSCSTPMNLVVENNITDVNIEWSPANNNATGYKIYRNNQNIGVVDATTTQFTETLFEDGNYCYQVAAVCGQRESEKTSSVCTDITIPCDIPQNLSLNGDKRSRQLKWDLGIEATIEETFENYQQGQRVASESLESDQNLWTTYNLAVGSSEDALVSAQNASQGLQSMYCSNSDMVLKLNNRKTGHYIFSFDCNIQSGTDIVLSFLQTFGIEEKQYGAHIYFKPITISNQTYKAYFKVANGYKPFNFNENEWMNISFNINLDENTAQMFINDELIVDNWQFDWMVGGVGINQLAGFEFYAGSGSQLFVDNIKLQAVFHHNYNIYRNDSLITTTDNLLGFSDNEELPCGNYCYAVSLNCGDNESEKSENVCIEIPCGMGENTTMLWKVYPNPTQGILNIELNAENAVTLELVSPATGQILMREISTDKQMQFDLNPLAKGVYLLKVIDDNEVSTQKIIVY